MLLIMTRSETERRVEKASKGRKKENDLEEKEGEREEKKEAGDWRWVQLMKKAREKRGRRK